MIVGARMKATDDLATMIGWNAEKFAREGKKMRPLAHYLKRAKSPPASQSGQDVRRMFERIFEKQGGEDGTR